MKNIWLVLGILCGGCSVSTGYDIDDGDLAGTIDGESWSVRSGTTDSFLSDSSSYFVTLYGGNDIMTCDSWAADPTAPFILVSVPRTLGEHELSMSGEHPLTVTAVPEYGENVVLSNGIINVESIYGSTVYAGMYATDDFGSYEISGHFQATICD